MGRERPGRQSWILKLFVGRELDRVLPTGWTWNWQIQPPSPVTNIYITKSHQTIYSMFNRMIGGKLRENFINIMLYNILFVETEM